VQRGDRNLRQVHLGERETVAITAAEVAVAGEEADR
jgi:hypothetical protein